MRAEISKTALTFQRKRATIQTLPGSAAKRRRSTGAFSYDHMFDHNRLRRSWRQRRKERRRASFPERKGPNVVHAHVTPGSSPFGSTMPQVRILSLGPRRDSDHNAIRVPFFFPYCAWSAIMSSTIRKLRRCYYDKSIFYPSCRARLIDNFRERKVDNCRIEDFTEFIKNNGVIFPLNYQTVNV